MRTLAIVPARGGSKGVPRKALALLGGRPLLAFTAECALGCRTLDRVVLSTDDPEIAELGRQMGLDVPFLRPPELAQDNTPMIDVLRHAIDMLACDSDPELETVVLLQPTSPFRRSTHVDGAVALYRARGLGAVVSVVEVPHHFRAESQMRLGDGILELLEPGPPVLRRQDKKRTYARNGPAVLVLGPESIRAGQIYPSPLIPYPMDRIHSIDIDHLEDLRMAEALYPLWSAS